MRRIEKAIIKRHNRKVNPSFVRKILRKVKYGLLGATVAFSLAAIASGTVVSVEKKVPLPSEAQINQSIEYLEADDRYISFLETNLKWDKLVRMEMPKRKGSIKIVVSKNVDEYTKKEIKEEIADLNEVFEIINPAYKFEYSENLLHRLDHNAVKVYDNFEFFRKFVPGFKSAGAFEVPIPAIGSDKNIVQTYKNSIIISKEFCSKGTFLHEMMHALGLGDDYLLEERYSNTIMGLWARHLTKNDLYLLAALYGNFENEEEALLVKEKLDNYFFNQANLLLEAESIEINKNMKKYLFDSIERNMKIKIDPSAEIEEILEPNLILADAWSGSKLEKEEYLSKGSVRFYDLRDAENLKTFDRRVDNGRLYEIATYAPKTDGQRYYIGALGEYIGKIEDNYFLIIEKEKQAFYLEVLSEEEFDKIQEQSRLEIEKNKEIFTEVEFGQ